MVAMHGAILAFRLCGIREIGLFYPSLITANKVGDFFLVGFAAMNNKHRQS
jgi:hypothetical protein